MSDYACCPYCKALEGTKHNWGCPTLEVESLRAQLKSTEELLKEAYRTYITANPHSNLLKRIYEFFQGNVGL